MQGGYERLASVLRPELDETELECVWAVMGRLPTLQVRLEAGSGAGRVSATIGKDLTLQVTLTRPRPAGKEGLKVHAPKYPKPKEEGWLVVVGNPTTRYCASLSYTVLPYAV